MTAPSRATDSIIEAAFVAGRADLAGELLRLESLMLPSVSVHTLHRAALDHLKAGRYAEAERDLRTAIRMSPSTGQLHDHLGVVLASQRRLPEAEATFRVAERLSPADLSPRRNRGQCLMDLKRFDEAAGVYENLLTADENDDAARLQLAAALASLKRFADAERTLEPLVRPGRESVAAWDRLGVVRGLAGDSAGAVECFRAQLALDPQAAGAWSNLAAALGKSRDWAGAVEAGREAVRLDPNNGGGWSNLGNALRDLGRVDEALDALRTAVRLDPNQAEAVGNLALVLAMRGAPMEALPLYDRAVALNPKAAETRFNRAICLLSLGEFARGWPEYEWRFGTEQMRGHKRLAGTPWRGESLEGKSILVQCEQGHGDTLQFSRLAPRLKERGATVILLASPPLKRLLESVDGVDRVVTAGDAPQTDFVTPLMTLPLLTGLRLETIPRTLPSVIAPADAVQPWRTRLADVPGKKVGIAWQGNPSHVGDRFRSVPLTLFAPFAPVPGVTLVNLQLGAGREQLADVPFAVHDPFTDDPTDFADTAGLLENIDLVVTIDSAIAHLAGSLARPVWVLLPLNADWRWLQSRDDSPWYPTARLFRQARFGSWAEVFDRVAGELWQTLVEPGA